MHSGRYPPRGVPYKYVYVFFALGQIFCTYRRENLHDGELRPVRSFCAFGADIFMGHQITLTH